MKLIHCADLHIDSSLSTHFSKEQAKERRNELLITFKRLVSYAKDNDVKGIIIAGDLFDKKTISVSARKMVMDVIMDSPMIDFYYLVGNHDASAFLQYFDELPHNLKLFGPEWVQYDLLKTNKGKITITGADFNPTNTGEMSARLRLHPNDCNIVVLHGQISEYEQKGKGEIIDLEKYYSKNINYLALGHIHSYQEGKLPPVGTYCYPGCLEGRGFDEIGEHGFVLLEIDEEDFRITKQFIPFAYRKLLAFSIPLEGSPSSDQVINLISKEINGAVTSNDLIRIYLEGEIDIDAEIDKDLISHYFEKGFYYFQVIDNTKLAVDYSLYKKDASLKGEFVRTVEKDDSIPEGDKAAVIRCGLRALAGEELF